MIRVLVVDDHAVVREGLARLLGVADGIECVGAAGDARTALDMVERLDPDVVLLDLFMPDENGITVIRELRNRDSPVRMLVLTSFAEADLVLEAVHAGADGYLLKSSTAEVIFDGVRAVTTGRAPVDPTAARSLLLDVQARRQPLLTEREQQVLALLREGRTNKAIARRLNISERTVKAHVTQILRRTGLSDRTQAALWAERHLGPSAGSSIPP